MDVFRKRQRQWQCLTFDCLIADRLVHDICQYVRCRTVGTVENVSIFVGAVHVAAEKANKKIGEIRNEMFHVFISIATLILKFFVCGEYIVCVLVHKSRKNIEHQIECCLHCAAPSTEFLVFDVYERVCDDSFMYV